MEHTKTTEDAILGIIRKVSNLQKSLVKYTKQHFLNATQEAALHQADLSYYVYCLPPVQRRKLFESCSYTIPCKYIPVKHGRFVVVDGVVTFYNAEQHGSGFERMELDEDLLRTVLRKIKEERKKEFWEGLPGDASPQNLIDDLDIKLTPHLSLIKETSGFDIRQAIIGQSYENVDIEMLTKVSHELLRVLEFVRHEKKENTNTAESESQELVDEKPVVTEQGKSIEQTPVLNEDEVKILNYLNEEFPTIRYQQDIAAIFTPARERKTIGKMLDDLMAKSLVSRPPKKKKGYIITEFGQKYIAEHYT